MKEEVKDLGKLGDAEAGGEIVRLRRAGDSDSDVSSVLSELGVLDRETLKSVLKKLSADPNLGRDLLNMIAGLLQERDHTRDELKAAFEAIHHYAGESAEHQESAERDDLTGLYNKKAGKKYLKSEISRCRRSEIPLSLVMVDIDFFKIVNDTYGHQAGDEVLKQFAELISSRLRSTDISARYGGEEFMLVLPDAKLEQAVQIAEDLKAILADTIFKVKSHDGTHIRLEITASFGVEEFSSDYDANRLIARADKALYCAKESGRDRVATIHTSISINYKERSLSQLMRVNLRIIKRNVRKGARKMLHRSRIR